MQRRVKKAKGGLIKPLEEQLSEPDYAESLDTLPHETEENELETDDLSLSPEHVDEPKKLKIKSIFKRRRTSI
jgi:hypothetical protein